MADTRRPPTPMLLSILATFFGAYLGAADYVGLPHPELSEPLLALVYGIAIVGAAFLLSWAAEAAQVDISAGLALAVLALLAVLPEYAVDFVFTYKAGEAYSETGSCPTGPENPCALALANMTGANRVLVGVGWPLVVLIASLAVLRARRAGGGDSASASPGEVRLLPPLSAEVVFLGIASLYSLTLPLKSSLTLWDAGILVAIFLAYAWRLAQAPATEPDLMGVSEWVGTKDTKPRRAIFMSMFAFAALVILATAEHFSESLVATGSELGVDEFLLVQWVAPLASESPELLVACLYAWRLAASNSLGALLSSKVNQWTLLVGTIPIVFALTTSSTTGLPLETDQRYELLLTAAQSLFAVALLLDRSLSVWGACGLLGLFLIQFFASIFLSADADRLVIQVLSAIYLALAAAETFRRRSVAWRTLKDGLFTSFKKLENQAEAAEEAAK